MLEKSSAMTIPSNALRLSDDVIVGLNSLSGSFKFPNSKDGGDYKFKALGSGEIHLEFHIFDPLATFPINLSVFSPKIKIGKINLSKDKNQVYRVGNVKVENDNMRLMAAHDVEVDNGAELRNNAKKFVRV
ncbi:MAG: hypothetical protein R3B45_17125 [Bdellovibrionota bacterium]